jgi:hypothetical protein
MRKLGILDNLDETDQPTLFWMFSFKKVRN